MTEKNELKAQGQPWKNHSWSVGKKRKKPGRGQKHSRGMKIIMLWNLMEETVLTNLLFSYTHCRFQ